MVNRAENIGENLSVDTVGPIPTRVFFGHHKCATGWIDNILMELCFHMGIQFYMAHTVDHFKSYGSLGNLVKEKEIDFLAYTNADIDFVSGLIFHRGFHVVRDPRDILVSAYFSHMHSHSTRNWPALEAHRKQLKSLSFEEGLFCEMAFSKAQFEAMYRWDYEQEKVLEIRMEDLTAYPLDMFMRILRFLDLLDESDQGYLEATTSTLQFKMNRLNQKGRRYMPANLPMFPVPRIRRSSVTCPVLHSILEQKSFKRLSGGRKKGQENVKNHFRKGVAGDWRNQFTEAHIAKFKSEFNPLLLKLGYETDPDWTVA